MCYHAKNGSVEVDGADMDYIVFGNGKKPLVLIPGVGDGLKTVKGMAVPFAVQYRAFAADYRVYAFSRKNGLEPGCTTRDMARELGIAMGKLDITGAYVVGVSQGGMIAQYLAIDYPALVDKLVLVVSAAGQNETMRTAIGGWIAMARANDYKALFIDSTEKAYTEAYVKRIRWLYPVLARASKPKDLGRFIIQAEACLTHDAVDALSGIHCPTLVIGGDSDNTVGRGASEELAAHIAGSELYIYKGLGHATYSQAKDFPARVLAFLNAGA